MRRTILLGLLLIVIAGAAVYFSQRDQGESIVDEDYEGNFAVKNAAEIGRIVLKHRAGPTYILTKERDCWMVNGKYKARMSSVNPLLDAVRLVKMQYIPSDKAKPNVMENIEGTYIHVSVEKPDGTVLKSYRVGGATPDERGTYMLRDGSDQPFAVHIPSWDGALRTRFALNLQEWRDRQFMPFSENDIKQVVVNYPAQRSQSFRLEKGLGGFELSPLYPEMRNYSDDYRRGTGEVFFKALAEAACEGFENQFASKDSIYALTPFCEIEVQLEANGGPFQVRIWPKGVPVYTQYSSPVHRLFVDVRPGDFVLAQFEVIKGMLRGYDFFVGEETSLVF